MKIFFWKHDLEIQIIGSVLTAPLLCWELLLFYLIGIIRICRVLNSQFSLSTYFNQKYCPEGRLSSDIFYLRKKKLVFTQFVVFQSSHRFNHFNIKLFHRKGLIVLLQMINKTSLHESQGMRELI